MKLFSTIVDAIISLLHIKRKKIYQVFQKYLKICIYYFRLCECFDVIDISFFSGSINVQVQQNDNEVIKHLEQTVLIKDKHVQAFHKSSGILLQKLVRTVYKNVKFCLIIFKYFLFFQFISFKQLISQNTNIPTLS